MIPEQSAHAMGSISGVSRFWNLVECHAPTKVMPPIVQVASMSIGWRDLFHWHSFLGFGVEGVRGAATGATHGAGSHFLP